MPVRAAGLSAAKVRTAAAGRHGDGDGLYLLVRSEVVAFWVFRYTRTGRMREMGLGRARGADKVDLADAREAARGLRAIIRNGTDPLDKRDAEAAAAKAGAQQAAVAAITFRTVTEGYLAAHAAGWQNAKHRYQWGATLTSYVFPHFGDVPVAEVGTGHVLAALHPLWSAKPETAVRVRGRIESILDYAKAMRWREGENPATWRGHLVKLLPSRSKVAPVQHHAALPWSQVGGFMALLCAQPGLSARALEFAILTAGRSGEVLGATWGEVEPTAGVWTVPAARMKAKREHRVPLSEPVLTLLEGMQAVRIHAGPDAYVFPGAVVGKPLSNMALTMTLRRMKRPSAPAIRTRSRRRCWRMSSATRWKRPISAAIYSRSGAG